MMRVLAFTEYAKLIAKHRHCKF